MKQLFVSRREPAFSREVYLDERWAKAFQRAIEERRQAIFVAHDHFQVHSSRSTRYKPLKYDITYAAKGLTGWICSCPSGDYWTACKHRARVLIRLEREPHLTNPPPPPLVVRSEIARARELRERATVIQAHSARLKVEYDARREREMAGAATRLEDFYE